MSQFFPEEMWTHRILKVIALKLIRVFFLEAGKEKKEEHSFECSYFASWFSTLGILSQGEICSYFALSIRA